MTSGLKKIVVLASGTGSNFVAIDDAARIGNISAKVVGLICDRPAAPVIELARKRNVPVKIFSGRPHDSELIEAIRAFQPDVICLAGYMRILGASVVEAFEGKILNIHPSLLPKYRGLHAQRQAVEAKEKQTGCTVHVVTADLDAGPVLVQKTLPILPSDDEKSLSERLKPLEHMAYVEALQQFFREN